MNFNEVSEKINSYKTEIKNNLKENFTLQIDSVYKTLGDLFENLKKECCREIDNQVDSYIKVINQDIVSLGQEVTRNLSCLSHNLAGIPQEQNAAAETKLAAVVEVKDEQNKDALEKDNVDGQVATPENVDGVADGAEPSVGEEEPQSAQTEGQTVADVAEKTENPELKNESKHNVAGAQDKKTSANDDTVKTDIKQELDAMRKNIQQVKSDLDTLSEEQKKDIQVLTTLQDAAADPDGQSAKGEENADKAGSFNSAFA